MRQETVEEWVARGNTITVLPPGPLPENYRKLRKAKQRCLELTPDGQTDCAEHYSVEEEV